MRIRNNWLRSSRRYWPITLASILAFIVITKLLFNSSTQSLSVMSDMNVSEAEATHATKPTGVEDASQSVVSSAPAATPGSPSTSTPPFTTTTSTTTASSDAAPPPLMTDFTAIASTSSPGSAFLPSAEQSAPSQSTAPRVTASSTASPSSSSSSSAIEYLSKEELIGFTNKTVLADLQGMGFTEYVTWRDVMCCDGNDVYSFCPVMLLAMICTLLCIYPHLPFFPFFFLFSSSSPPCFNAPLPPPSPLLSAASSVSLHYTHAG